MTTTNVSRDPFGRSALSRRSFPPSSNLSCGWCGASNRRLFSYTTEYDGRSLREFERSARLFCNLDCFHSFVG